MDILEAIDTRISCRAYADRQVEPEKISQIQELVDQINAEQHLHLQLYGPTPDGKPPVAMGAAMFAGPVYHYVACAVADDPAEKDKVGYFGEKIVLLATQLGLGTCWVASTYDKSCAFELAPGEVQFCIITIGYPAEKMPLKQRAIRSGLRAKDKPYEKLVSGDVANAPAWFKDGVMCARKAPTAVNLQPVVFDWTDGVVRARLVEKTRPAQDADLGICKLHFEIGSGQHGTWEWGSNGAFVIA